MPSVTANHSSPQAKPGLRRPVITGEAGPRNEKFGLDRVIVRNICQMKGGKVGVVTPVGERTTLHTERFVGSL